MTMAEMQEAYGEFAMSLTERVKRRRRQVSYREDGDSEDEDEGPPKGRSTTVYISDDDSQSNSSYVEGIYGDQILSLAHA